MYSNTLFLLLWILILEIGLLIVGWYVEQLERRNGTLQLENEELRAKEYHPYR